MSDEKEERAQPTKKIKLIYVVFIFNSVHSRSVCGLDLFK